MENQSINKWYGKIPHGNPIVTPLFPEGGMPEVPEHVIASGAKHS